MLKDVGGRRERGSILVMTALVLTALLGVTALAVDVGSWYDLRNRMAAAADGAARSAGVAAKGAGCTCNSPCATLDNFARDAVTRSGFSTTDVTINHAPTSGPFASDCNYVEAIVSRSTVPTFFRRVLDGATTVSVGARAVASIGGNDPPCITTLDPNAVGIDMTAGPVTMPGCTINVNTTVNISASTFNLTGTGGAADGFVYVSGATCNNCSTRIVPSGNYQTNTGVSYPDPFASYTAPWDSTVDPCTGSTVGQSKSDGAGHTYSVRSTSRYTSGGTTLSPGIYCGGIGIGGSGTTTFTAGIYILYGAPGSQSSFQTNTSGTMNATTPPAETLFYATGAPAASSSAWKFPSQRMLDVNPSGTVNLKAPTSGDWAGLLFFQDRSWSSGTNSQITGGGATCLEGFIYIANTGSTDPTIRFSGGSGCSWNQYTSLIVPSMTFTGGSILKNNVSQVSGGVFGKARLAE